MASPVPTGTGRIKIAHGECSIPAPATAELLRGIPLAASAIVGRTDHADRGRDPGHAGRLVRPAAGDDDRAAIGYGAGQKDFEEQAEHPAAARRRNGRGGRSAGLEADQVCVLETNLDDMSGELVGYCTARLWEAGALDVYTTAIQMKKNRPGVKLTVLCRPTDADAMETILFRETTTLGVRRALVNRRLLRRQRMRCANRVGAGRGQDGWLADGTPRFAPEFEACRRIAAERGLPLRTVYERVLAAVGSG